VRPAVVLGRDLDVLVVFAPVSVAIFDPQIGEVDLLIGLYDTLPISRTYLSASPLFVRSIRSKVNR
jgi:hypothetical protein